MASSVVPSGLSIATEIRCWPGASDFSITTTHSPLASATVSANSRSPSNMRILAAGAAVPANNADPSGLTRAISSTSASLSSGGTGSVVRLGDGASGAGVGGLIDGVAGAGISTAVRCGATGLASSSPSSTTARANSTKIPPMANKK